MADRPPSELIPRLLSAREVAERLGVSPGVVTKLAQRGEIPSIRVGGRLRFSVAGIVAWLEAGGSPRPAPKPTRRKRRR